MQHGFQFGSKKGSASKSEQGPQKKDGSRNMGFSLNELYKVRPCLWNKLILKTEAAEKAKWRWIFLLSALPSEA